MTTRWDSRPLVLTALLVAVLVAVRAAFLLLPGIYEPLKAKITDRLFVLRGDVEALRPVYDDTVIHVAIEDQGLHETGNHYLGRAEHAQLVRNLGRAGVAVQLHDVIFAAPQPGSGDRALIEATREAGNAYYGIALGLATGETRTAPPPPGPEALAVLERNRWRLTTAGSDAALLRSTRHFMTFPEVALAARGLGFLDIHADGDGVYRRLPLVARDGDAFFPSMALRIVCDYLGIAPGRIHLVPGRTLTLRGARRPGAETDEDIVIPIDRQGRVIVNYLGPWGRMKHYPFSAIYEASDDRFMMEDLREEIEGTIAVVSWVATGSGDIGPVPTDPQYPLSGIHASVMHSILSRDFLREATSTEMLLWIEIPLLLLLLAAALRLSTIPFLIFASLLTVSYCVAGGVAFLYGKLVLDIPGPIHFLVGSTVIVSAYHYHLESKARAVVHNTFERYFPPAVVARMVSRPGQLLAAAQKKELSVLFSDIVGFTSHTARMDAEHVRTLLNEYLEKMTEIVFRHEGTVDKFMGDGLMVFFGDPEPQPDHAARCIRAAIEMQLATRELAAVWSRRGDMPLEIRVGINTGEVVVGNMGSSHRVSYTVLGEAVNLAQRLESSAPVGGILVSARTYELAGEVVAARKLDPIRVKGFDEPVAVYEVPVAT